MLYLYMVINDYIGFQADYANIDFIQDELIISYKKYSYCDTWNIIWSMLQKKNLKFCVKLLSVHLSFSYTPYELWQLKF